jgi:hypothetical protein
MISTSRSTYSFIYLAILGLSFFSMPFTTYACSPPAPDFWFTEQISLPAADLPSGVGVRVLQITRYAVTRDYVELTNRSATPLYIIGKFWAGATTFEPLPYSLPAGVGPMHKILSQQAFAWEAIDTQRHMAWNASTHDHPDAVLLSIDQNRVASDKGHIVDLAPRNQTGDNRPAQIQPPAPQTVLLPLIYGTQFLYVPVMISYAVNPTYKPNSVARSFQACRNIGSSTCLIGLIFVGGIAPGWLSYRRWNSRHIRNTMGA